MCGGVIYEVQTPLGLKKERRVFFPNPKARLPVLSAEEQLSPTVWGNRGEFERIPKGGWARLESLVKGTWTKYRPKKVSIPVLSWMEKDAAGQSHWFPMQPEAYLLGIQVTVREREDDASPSSQHKVVYVVTQAATEGYQSIHERQPVLTRRTYSE